MFFKASKENLSNSIRSIQDEADEDSPAMSNLKQVIHEMYDGNCIDRGLFDRALDLAWELNSERISRGR